jgi:hypothetical protein
MVKIQFYAYLQRILTDFDYFLTFNRNIRRSAAIMETTYFSCISKKHYMCRDNTYTSSPVKTHHFYTTSKAQVPILSADWTLTRTIVQKHVAISLPQNAAENVIRKVGLSMIYVCFHLSQSRSNTLKLSSDN